MHLEPVRDLLQAEEPSAGTRVRLVRGRRGAPFTDKPYSLGADDAPATPRPLASPGRAAPSPSVVAELDQVVVGIEQVHGGAEADAPRLPPPGPACCPRRGRSRRRAGRPPVPGRRRRRTPRARGRRPGAGRPRCPRAPAAAWCRADPDDQERPVLTLVSEPHDLGVEADAGVPVVHREDEVVQRHHECVGRYSFSCACRPPGGP